MDTKNTSTAVKDNKEMTEFKDLLDDYIEREKDTVKKKTQIFEVLEKLNNLKDREMLLHKMSLDQYIRFQILLKDGEAAIKKMREGGDAKKIEKIDIYEQTLGEIKRKIPAYFYISEHDWVEGMKVKDLIKGMKVKDLISGIEKIYRPMLVAQKVIEDYSKNIEPNSELGKGLNEIKKGVVDLEKDLKCTGDDEIHRMTPLVGELEFNKGKKEFGILDGQVAKAYDLVTHGQKKLEDGLKEMKKAMPSNKDFAHVIESVEEIIKPARKERIRSEIIQKCISELKEFGGAKGLWRDINSGKERLVSFMNAAIKGGLEGAEAEVKKQAKALMNDKGIYKFDKLFKFFDDTICSATGDTSFTEIEKHIPGGPEYPHP